MVTASHNPPQDNGYKVYLGGRADSGVQLVPPADAEIAAQIAAVGRTLDVPMETDGWSTLDDGIVEDYLDAAVRAVLPGGPRDLDVVLTPLHGVGGSTVVAALTRAGFAEPYVVPQQAAPDPAFPTVAFPNPEEPGAIDLALAAARERGADLVIANDPDADRCAVAVPDPSADGGWRMLRGDEVGALLGEHLLSRAPAPDGAVVANSVVSSELLSRIAAAHGVRHEVTLTGFKWIARVPGLFYGYEEALGYCLGARAGARQGRHHRRPRDRRAGRCAEGERPDPARRPRRPRSHARRARHRPALDPGGRPVTDRSRPWRRSVTTRPPPSAATR